MKLTRIVLATAFALGSSACLPEEPTPPLAHPIEDHTRDAGDWRARVSSLNIWDLPVISRYQKERMPLLGEELAELNPDFVLLQEAWTKSGRNRVWRASKMEHAFSFPAPGSIGTGLFVLSVEPFGRLGGRIFGLAGQLGRVWEGDTWAGKGVGRATVNLRGLPVTFFDTHLLARYGSSAGSRDRFTMDRKTELFDVFCEIVEQTDSDAFIVAGDFNMHIGHEEYDFWKKLTGLPGTYFEETDPEFCTSCDDNIFKKDGSGQIDFIFLSPRLRFISAVRDFDDLVRLESGKQINLSDHYGLSVEVRVGRDEAVLASRQVRENLKSALLELKLELGQFEPKRFEEGLCRSCEVEKILERVNEYLRVLNGAEDLSYQEQAIKTRLESYLDLF